MQILNRVSLTQKALFTKHLAVMLKAGVTILDAMEIAADEAPKEIKKILNTIHADIVSGESLANALEKHPNVFSRLYINIVSVGEESGTLPESLEQLARKLEKDHELSTKIFQAMLYPIIVMLTVTVVGGGIAVFVLPRLRVLFDVFEGELPLATKILLGFVDFFADYGAFAFIGGFILIIVFTILVRTAAIKPLWHALLLKVPIVKTIMKNVNLTNFNNNLGVLLKSGIPVAEALTITADATENLYYRRHIKKLLKGVQEGQSINKVMLGMNKVFPSITSKMIKIGEKSGRLDEVLTYLAGFYEAEIDKASKNLSSSLEPILLVIIGFVVGFVMIAIITPIYELTSTIGGG